MAGGLLAAGRSVRAVGCGGLALPADIPVGTPRVID